MSNFTSTSFQISSENILKSKRRQSIGTIFKERLEAGESPEETVVYKDGEVLTKAIEDTSISQDCENIVPSKETFNMADNRIVDILGDLASSKEQLEDFLEIDIRTLSLVTDVDEMRKEVKMIKANLHKYVSQLRFLKKDEDVSEYLELVGRGKKLITSLNDRMNDLLAESDQKKKEAAHFQQVKIFSIINVLISSLDMSFKRFQEKFAIDFENIENEELIMLHDSLSDVREEYNDLNKLYYEFTEKCPLNLPDREKLFIEYKACITEAEHTKATFEKSIRKQMQVRELTRNKIQNTTNEIKLASFHGYGKGPDYYSFKSQFLNKYRRYTSLDMVDILKNTYLKSEAYNTVKGLTNIDEIWVRLKEEFGDPCWMLRDKLTEILSVIPFTKIRSILEKREAVLKMINLLTDVFKLADDHDLQLELYCKNEKVLGKLITQLRRLWLHDWQACKKSYKKEVEEKVKDAPAWKKDQLSWEIFKHFLQEQLANLKEEGHIEESLKEISIDDKSKPVKITSKDSYHADWSAKSDDEYYDYEDFTDKKFGHTIQMKFEEAMCKLCKRKLHKHYWDCEVFMKMKHGERFELFVNPKKNRTPKPHVGKLFGECAACLVPDERFGHNCHEKENVKRWICKEAHQRAVHILCCRHHTESNEHLWEKFQFNTRFGFLQEDELIPTWKREMKWKMNYVCGALLMPECLESSMADYDENIVEKSIRDEGLFLFQKVAIDNEIYNVFYDSGCGDFCVAKSAVDRIGIRARQIKTGIFQITGAGNVKSEAQHGIYEVRMPLVNGNEAQFVGLCMNEVTSTFCEYNISSLYAELVDDYVRGGGKKEDLPSVSRTGICGGDTDIMIGIKYNRYLPRMVHQLESGLAIYRSSFEGIDGSTAVIGGPHPIISEIEREYSQRNKQFAVSNMKSYLSRQLQLYLDGYDICPDSRMSGNFDEKDCLNGKEKENKNFFMKTYKTFLEYEEAGTEINYRCLKCRSCKECKCGPRTEQISRREESEQYCIEKSVEFNVEVGKIECMLPLLDDPSIALGCNKNNARKIYQRWVSKMNKNPADLSSVINSEKKLQARGHVEYIRNLTAEQQKSIENSLFKYFLPWRPVWNEGSLTTPCRITFDAGDKTTTGVRLNDILPKGINQINSLLEIIIRWRNGRYAMASDIEQMYNGAKLSEKHWPLQMYLWGEDLRGVTPEIKVIRTLIYGVRSSSNQAITGVRRIAKYYQDEYPEVFKTLVEQIYVDDILPEGKDSLQACYTLADELVIVLERGGLKLKRFAFSTITPEPPLSLDGTTVGVTGMNWNTISDDMYLKVGPLNFAKKYRGKRPDYPECFLVPQKLTRRICTSKVGEIWDILGQFVPITARLKLDLHDIVTRKLNWDDEIPEELRKVWLENFKLIEQLDSIRFSRATVPMDAVSLEMETIEGGDASSSLICVGVYVRFKRKCGEYSCELVAGKSKCWNVDSQG